MRSLVAGLALLVSVAAADEPKIYTEFDSNPRPVRTPPPRYPEELAAKRTSGVVLVAVVLDEKGDVRSADVVKTSDPEFNEPTTAAVMKWKFAPGKKDGEAVWAKLYVPVHFSPES